MQFTGGGQEFVIIIYVIETQCTCPYLGEVSRECHDQHNYPTYMYSMLGCLHGSSLRIYIHFSLNIMYFILLPLIPTNLQHVCIHVCMQNCATSVYICVRMQAAKGIASLHT